MARRPEYAARRNALFEWDNAGLKALHHRLSDATKREVRQLAALFEARREAACPSA